MKSGTLVFAVIIALSLSGCGAKTVASVDAICASVFYAKKENARFDWEYYTQKHLPLVSSRFGTAMKGLSVDEGPAGGG